MTDGEQAVNRMLDYIDAHLQEPITAAELARAAGYSIYHAARVFRETVGMPPFEYIRTRRLEASAHALRNTSARVLDVALDFVFDSHEGFTRAFTRTFGITPKKYARWPDPEGWLVPYRSPDRHKTKTEESDMAQETTVIFTQIIERPARKLILFRSKQAICYFTYCEEVGCGGTPERPHPWRILSGIREALDEPMGVWLPSGMCPPGTGIYAHAVEVPADYTGNIPEGFDVIDLAPCKYLIFQGEPYDDERYQDAIGSLWQSIARFNPEVYGYAWDDDIAPRFQLAPMGWRGYIEGRPVKPLRK
ncbi:MAG: helix-turn-helix domain-containing protein [Eubacteriales bacterium]|jgi:AraC family transcriptional regulator